MTASDDTAAAPPRPPARPVASSQQVVKPAQAAASNDTSAHDIVDTQQSPPPIGPRRLSAQRLRHIADGLTAADWQLLREVDHFRVFTGDQLQRRFFDPSPASGRRARRQLLRLVQVDVLARLERRIGGVRGGSAGFIYTTGMAGQRLLRGHVRARRYREPGWQYLRHTLSISELYIELHELVAVHDDAELVTFEPEPHAWRSQPSPHSRERLHLRPDAYIELRRAQRRQHWFVEVDLGTESRPVIRRKMDRYAAWAETGYEQRHLDGVFPRVYWHTPDPDRRETLTELAAASDGPNGLHVTSGLLEPLRQTREPP